MKRQLVLIAHNVRSCHNVGSLLRTADGLGVNKVYLTGYTPYPTQKGDKRLPHLSAKIQKQIDKTALGADKTVEWEHQSDIFALIKDLKRQEYTLTALEQADNSIALNQYKPESKTALIVGREVEGIEPEVLEIVDKILEIPMFGQKESFNVAQAAAMALYKLTFS